MVRIIIVCDKGFEDRDVLQRICDKLIGDRKCEVVVERDAVSRFVLSVYYAYDKGVPIRHFEANKNINGLKAEYIRCELMAEYADELIAFWNGADHNTEMMITLARLNGLKVHVFNYRGHEVI